MATIESDCMNECTIYFYKVTISFIQQVTIWALLQRTDHNTDNFMPYCNNQKTTTPETSCPTVTTKLTNKPHLLVSRYVDCGKF